MNTLGFSKSIILQIISGNTTSSGGVIGSGRLNAVKQAFKHQYMSRFCAASTEGT